MNGEFTENSDGVRSVPQLPLPPGFRFKPTDQELVWCYLKRQANSESFDMNVIAEVDLYKFNPWEVPEKAHFGEREWYFFSPRSRKYPRGQRPNRAAGDGYWKATGTDKPIKINLGGHTKHVGLKKSLVFYQGKPPSGVKTNWIMHEYRLADGVAKSAHLHRRGSPRLDDWVLCRIYEKQPSQASRTAAASPTDHDMESMLSEYQYLEEPLRNDSASPEFEDDVDVAATGETSSFPLPLLAIDPSVVSPIVPTFQQTKDWSSHHAIASCSTHQAQRMYIQGLQTGQSLQADQSLNYTQFQLPQTSSSFTAANEHYHGNYSNAGQRRSFSDEVDEVQSQFQNFSPNGEGSLFRGLDRPPGEDLSFSGSLGMDGFHFGPGNVSSQPR